jgi:ribosomal protein L11 methyltransferase
VEVSLIVAGEMAEAVAEVMSRFVSGGVVIESTQIAVDQLDEGHPVGPLRVCGYLPCNAELDQKRHQIDEALWHLGRICQLPEAQFKPIQDTNWAEAWKQHYRPVAIGQRLLIIPTWLEPSKAGRIAVRMDPGVAFGTGTHPTTQLCLESIEDWFASKTCASQSIDEMTMIDVGCGSGILAIAALKLGAQRALGVDTDPQAVATARQNSSINRVSNRFEAGVGSVAEILAGRFSLRQAPLVVANILAPVLIRLLDEGMNNLVAPHGSLVLSGILREQAGEVEATAHASGLHLAELRQEEDWVAMVFKQRG